MACVVAAVMVALALALMVWGPAQFVRPGDRTEPHLQLTLGTSTLDALSATRLSTYVTPVNAADFPRPKPGPVTARGNYLVSWRQNETLNPITSQPILRTTQVTIQLWPIPTIAAAYLLVTFVRHHRQRHFVRRGFSVVE